MFQSLLYIVDTFYGRIFYRNSLVGLSGSTASNRWEEEILEERHSFFPSYKKKDQTNKFLTRKKGVLLKEKYDIFCGLRAIAGIAGLMPLRYCAFVVISLALNFPRGYFVSLEFFLVGISWLGFPDCNIFSCWLLSDRYKKYINNLKPSIQFQIVFNYC